MEYDKEYTLLIILSSRINSFAANLLRMNIPIEIYQLILGYSDFPSKIRVRCANKYLYAKLEICDFYHIDRKYRRILTNDILRTYPFITKLDADSNVNITNVNHLTRLEILRACGAYGACGIDDQGISNLKLKKLYCTDNPRITNVNFMSSSLKKLDAGGTSGINDSSISKLDLLVFLDATYNSKITNINHMTNLKTLYKCDSGISDEHIKLMGLKNLDVIDVPKLVSWNRVYDFLTTPRMLIT